MTVSEVSHRNSRVLGSHKKKTRRLLTYTYTKEKKKKPQKPMLKGQLPNHLIPKNGRHDHTYGTVMMVKEAVIVVIIY